MSNRIDTKIVLGSLRYKTATDTNIFLQVPFLNTHKELDEFDRTSVINLAQVFQNERQSSTCFRLTSKIDLLFENKYSGLTSVGGLDYKPFTNNLYYVNPTQSFYTTPPTWSGFPQYHEFSFIRMDRNVSGYTTNSGNTPPHVGFVTKSASTYNWTQYVSYVYENDYTRVLQYYPTPSNPQTWQCGEGIPFYMTTTNQSNGQPLISFMCPVYHNLQVGDWVELEFSAPWTGYNGVKTFQVYSLGNSGFDSDKYIFNLYNIGYSGTTLGGVGSGTFKRILDINNSAETKSIYYVRKHKIITEVNDAILTLAGFEQNGFNIKQQYEYQVLTPNNTARISLKEGNQSYLLTFSKDIDVSQYRDNFNRPLSELFITIINKGYFGWMNKPLPLSTSGIREGYQFNITPVVSPYWDTGNNSINGSNILAQSYTQIQTTSGVPTTFTFYYNKNTVSGDTLYGDFCEFNNFEQIERVISPLYHKLWFTPELFKIHNTPTSNPNGYYYQPHHSISISSFSDYLEEVDFNQSDNVPDYAYYSEYKKLLIWRDIYSYGFVDELGLGVDYPFLNGCHYPSVNLIFRVIPEGMTEQDITTIPDPITDDCE